VADEPGNEELWRDLLTEHYSPTLHMRRRYRRYPGNPRCKQCLVPLGGPVHPLVRMITKKAPSRKNPRFCDTCETFAETHPGGAEIELTMLFADVRGSTALAEQTTPAEFHHLMARFHKEASNALIDADGLVDRIVGDEVVGLFLPMLADHARQAVQAAIRLLEATTAAPGRLSAPASIPASRTSARWDSVTSGTSLRSVTPSTSLRGSRRSQRPGRCSSARRRIGTRASTSATPRAGGSS
jgi:adenylate cyclase